MSYNHLFKIMVFLLVHSYFYYFFVLFYFLIYFCPFLFIFCYQSQLRKSTASVSSIASGPKDPNKEVRMALHQSQEVLAMAAAAAAKGPVALPQKDVCFYFFLFCMFSLFSPFLYFVLFYFFINR